jgi:hypothetical protein
MKFGRQEITIDEDFDAVIFNRIASTILKWLRLNIVKWIYYLYHFQPC